MTRRRLRGVGSLTIGLVAALTASVALAEPAEPAAAEQPVTQAPVTQVPAAPTPAPAVQAPDASVAFTSTLRPWLRATKPAAVVVAAPAAASTSPWRALSVLVVLGALGGAALVMRKKRSALAVLPESATRVRVLSSARIGPKANAVVAEVGGRVLLLGVTDTSVSRLAWLDRDTMKAAPQPRPATEMHVERQRTMSREPVETADADVEPPPARGMASRFGEVLDRALGVKPPAQRHEFRANPGVAALLAAGVEDVVEARGTMPRTTARMGSAASVIVEEQVAGLKRSRRRA
jgi:flagellar biogenesis protein FliO